MGNSDPFPVHAIVTEADIVIDTDVRQQSQGNSNPNGHCLNANDAVCTSKKV